MTEQTPETSEWVPLAAASRRLGIPIDTLRRKVKRGDLTARQVPTRQGHRWEVWLVDDQSPAEDPATAASQEPAERDALILELTRRNEQLAGQVGFLQAQLQGAQERIALLEAPVQTISTELEEKAPESAPPRRWWRFW